MSIANECLDNALTFISLGAFCGGVPFLAIGCAVGIGFGWSSFAIGAVTASSISLLISIGGGTILCKKDYWREKQVNRINEVKENLKKAYNNTL